MIRPPHIFLTPVFLLLLLTVTAQHKPVLQKDINDFLFRKKHISLNNGNDSFEIGKLYPSVLPIPGYNPALGFVLGGGVSAGLLTGNQRTTHISNFLANVTVTTKSQVNVNFRSNVFLKDDGWILQGDWRWLLFSQPTYGLGVNFNSPQEGGAGCAGHEFQVCAFL